MAEIFEVSQINEYLRQRFEADEFLGSLLIRGELSNYKIYPSGHHYFTLKDSQSAIRCVMFKGSAMRLRFRPETGMKVIAGGRIAVFPRDGAYQLYCTSLTPEDVMMAMRCGKRGRACLRSRANRPSACSFSLSCSKATCRSPTPSGVSDVQ